MAGKNKLVEHQIGVFAYVASYESSAPYWQNLDEEDREGSRYLLVRTFMATDTDLIAKLTEARKCLLRIERGEICTTPVRYGVPNGHPVAFTAPVSSKCQACCFRQFFGLAP